MSREGKFASEASRGDTLRRGKKDDFGYEGEASANEIQLPVDMAGPEISEILVIRQLHSLFVVCCCWLFQACTEIPEELRSRFVFNAEADSEAGLGQVLPTDQSLEVTTEVHESRRLQTSGFRGFRPYLHCHSSDM